MGRNYPFGSRGFYEEHQHEMESYRGKKYTDIELIKIHLRNMEAVFHQYKEQIEIILNRIGGK